MSREVDHVLDPLSEFEDYLTARRAEALASPRSGSREAAAPASHGASESPVGTGLGELLEATGAAGGSGRQSIGFAHWQWHPGSESMPGAAFAAGDDSTADTGMAALVATLLVSAFMSPAASQQLKGLLTASALEQSPRLSESGLGTTPSHSPGPPP
jgi:hypothetical protein